MCYSAMVRQSLKNLSLEFEARVQLDLFAELYEKRARGERIRLPKALDFNFEGPSKDPLSIAISENIERYRSSVQTELEQELFAQKKRLANAERKLAAKALKTAEKEKGIAERKIEAAKRRLERLRSEKELPEDSRIFATDYAPVVIWERGQRVIKPMRYLCRPAGFPETFDRDYPGCYNARRDSLEKFWKKQYRRNHAILVISSFFENVKRHRFEGRELARGEPEQNLVIQFKPDGFDEMIVPCIWDRWTDERGNELYSFALITDEPPREIQEAGHDRCPIFLKRGNIDAWLQPESLSEEATQALLNDRELPFYRSSSVA